MVVDNESFINSFAGASIGAWLSIIFSKADGINNIKDIIFISVILMLQLFFLFGHWGYLLKLLNDIKKRKMIVFRDHDFIRIIKTSIGIFVLQSLFFLIFAYTTNATGILPYGMVIMFAWIGSIIMGNLPSVEFNYILRGNS